jgi:hypothetical protein
VSCEGAAEGSRWVWVGIVVSAALVGDACDGGTVVGFGLVDLIAEETVLGYCRFAAPAALEATLEDLLPIASRIWW